MAEQLPVLLRDKVVRSKLALALSGLRKRRTQRASVKLGIGVAGVLGWLV